MKLPIREYIVLLHKYLKKYKTNMIILMIILGLNVAIQLINPQILRYFIDEVQGDNGGKNLMVAALLFIGFALIKQLFIVIATYISENIGWSATNGLRVDLIEHCINLDVDFHKKHQPGELVERVDGDVNALFRFFSTFMLDLLTNGALLIGILFLLFKEEIRVGIVVSIFIIASVIVMGYIEKKSSKYWTEQRENSAKLYGFLGEQVTSVEDINTCGAKDYVMNNLYKIFRKMLPIQVKADMGYYHMWMGNLVIFSMANVMALLLSAYLYENSMITFGTVYLIFYYTELIVNPLEEIKMQMQDLQKAEASIRRIKELFDTKSNISYGNETICSEDTMNLSVKDICFEYEKGDMILKNISFDLPQNKILGVLGHTGSGKTTLARLIVRLYDITSGAITLEEKNIKDIRKEDLIKNISYVTQEVEIFHATVKDNLTLFNCNIKDEEILEVIEDMGLMPWLNKLPNGIYTILESGGSGLSAGEAQLLAFIRVFLKNPKLVILDEATSRLDPITEELIEKALNKLLSNRTAIIIAHRLWTVQRADDILILDKGNIKEYGSREQLEIDENSQFYNLLRKGMEEVLV